MTVLAQRTIAVAFFAGLMVLAGTGTALAESSASDYPIENGHFYRQAAGSNADKGHGFRITDDESIPFWTEFQRLGGVEVLGYPISQRFEMDGFVCQATQRAILQWNAAEERVELINIMDYLSKLGMDDKLSDSYMVPRAAPDASDELRDIWLDMNPKIKSVYRRTNDALAVFGLPLSPAQAMGPAVAMRFQRGVIYAWEQPQPWTGADGVSIGNSGDFVKEANGIPKAALAPESPPPVRVIVQPRSPRPDQRASGVATWYGEYFQGSPMANGIPYNMWDPSICAANIYPMGTWLRVTRVSTGESVVVKVSDRGAFRYPIIVDLSYAAFSKLAHPDVGVIGIIVEPLE